VNELLSQYPNEVQQILAKYPENFRKSAVMPLLHLAQRELGYLTKKHIAQVAEITGLSTTDVDSVVGFYTLFHEEEAGGARHGRYRIQVCNDLPCALRGADEFLQKLCENIGVKVGETTADGLITVEAVTCLAGCHRAPLFQLQGDGDLAYHENQTVESAMQVVAGLRARAEGGK
jgi:NADH-quinone oxidoreductase subunit E